MPKQFLLVTMIFSFLLIAQEPPRKKQKTEHVQESAVKKLFQHMSDAFAKIPEEPVTFSQEKQAKLRNRVAQLVISIAFLQRTDLALKSRIAKVKEKQQELLELYQEVKPMYQQLHTLTKQSCKILKITKPFLQIIEQEEELDDEKLFNILAKTNSNLVGV